MVTKKKYKTIPFKDRLYNAALLVLKLAAKREEPIKDTREYIIGQIGLRSVELSIIETATPQFPYKINPQKRVLLRGLFKAELGLDFVQQHEIEKEEGIFEIQ